MNEQLKDDEDEIFSHSKVHKMSFTVTIYGGKNYKKDIRITTARYNCNMNKKIVLDGKTYTRRYILENLEDFM